MNKLLIILLLTYTSNNFPMISITTKALRYYTISHCKIPKSHLKINLNKKSKNLLDTYKVSSKDELIRKYTNTSNLSNNKNTKTKHQIFFLRKKFLEQESKRKENCELNEHRAYEVTGRIISKAITDTIDLFIILLPIITVISNF